MKICKKCGLPKSTAKGKDFYDDPEAVDGLRGTCKWCMTYDAKERYKRIKLRVAHDDLEKVQCR